MESFDLSIRLNDLIWWEDKSGDEVGFGLHDVVSLFTQIRKDGKCYFFYIDKARMELLDFWVEGDWTNLPDIMLL